MDSFIWLGIAAVVVIGGGVASRILKPKARAKGRELGMNYGEQFADKLAADSLTKATSKLGTTLVVPVTAERAVRDALASANMVTPAGQDRWNLAFAKPDDIRFGWSVVDGKGVLRVERSVEMLSEPVGFRQWTKLLTSLESTLQAAGIAPERGSVEFQRNDADTPAAHWTAI